MINQTEAKLWMEDLLKNPPKVKQYLMTADGNCPLGRYCLLYLEPKRGPISSSWFSFVDEDSRLPSRMKNFTLPITLAKKLNITEEGHFTDNGIDIVKKWLIRNHITYSNCASVGHINDETEATLEDAGRLIQHLAMVEQRDNKEMFEPYYYEYSK